MPLRNDLLNPISEANPAGENLRYAPVYDKIKEARREDDEGPQGIWARERKVADWASVVKLASEALATKTKDLQLAAWLAEAMLRREGAAGLQETLDVIRGLIENFWEGLYPELEDGDAEFRAAPLQWLGDRLEIPVKSVALTKSRLNWFQYKESRSIGTEEQAAESDTKRAMREQAIADGKVTQEDFDKAFAETSKQFYVSLLESFDAATESVKSLTEVCDEKFGDVAPSFSSLERVLGEVRQTVYILLQAKRETEPDAPVAEAEPEPEPELAAEPEPVAAGSAAAAPARAPIKKGALSAEPADRPDAVERVIAVATFLRKTDQYDPAPYLLLRGLRWGELRAGGASVDQSLLAAPSTEVRQNIKKLSLEGNWAGVLEACELAVGQECGRGWLDLQRYVARACYELGSWYANIRSAVISSLRTLLTDYPDLPQFTLMDDTPVANAETVAWLKEEVVPPAPEPAAAAEPEPAYTPAPAWEQPTGTAAEPVPDTFDLAMQAARSGRPQEAIEMISRELSQERSGRGRFQRKVQLAQLCVSIGHEAVAHPILQELAAEIERRKLEDWEASDVVAHPLALLYGLSREASAEERQKLYSWICRLDPLQALNVSR